MKRILMLMRNAGGWLAPIALVVGLIALARWFEDATGVTLNLWGWAVIATVLGVPALVVWEWARAWKQAQERPSFPFANLLWGTFVGGGIALLLALARWFEDATGVTLNLWGWAVIATVLGVPALVMWEWTRAWKQAQERPSFPFANLLWGTFGGGGIVLLLALANSGAPSTAVDDDWRASAPTPTATPAPIATPAIRARDVPTTAINEPRGYGIGVIQLADGRIRVALERARAQNEYTLSAHIARLYDALDAYVEAHHLMADTTWMPFPPPPLPALRLTRLFDAGDELTDAWDALFQYGLVSPGTGGQSGCLDSLLEVTYATIPMLPPTNPILYRFYTYYDFELARLAEFDEDAREARERTADALLTCTRALGGGA